MKLTKEERSQRWAAFHKMTLTEKLDYILTYFKISVILAVIALCVLLSVVFGQFTKQTYILYVGLVNVEAGSQLQTLLTADFVEHIDNNPPKEAVLLYQGLYLTDDPASEVFQYVYASRMKILASIESHQLDVVVMNGEAYDAFSQSGYLLHLEDYFTVSDGLVTNLVIYDSNAEQGSAAVTGTEANALDCSHFAFYQQAGFTEPLYLGVVGNGERLETTMEYIRYLKTQSKSAA